ncbi:F0F1 ATP synthase subunit A [Mycoplasma sp. 888]|uniref:F0F1 ATP synthase subunit A n=1 Tax=Mycoplasma sp. 888 TaxID=3108483 RepID=UPI002D792E17|nr:F0F1 ATP synthase subunit A [Mycoplasma sp. 888]WRQ25575.1 F0F1 ATP synthase subunit A [Mycoplasma sp. 888]
MDTFSKGLWVWNQPQMLSLVVTVFIVLIICLVVYFKVSKIKPNEAPKGVALIAEGYVKFIGKTFDDATGGTQVQNARYYILTLATFILIGNLTAVFGLEPIVTSYSVPLTLALMSWLGIFVCGAVYRKWRYLKSFINPLDLPGKVSPLISLSFRIYGNVIGGSTVIFLFYSFCGWIWTKVTGSSNQQFFFGLILSPALHFYFDLFGSTLQAYIFSLLTLVYWTIESTAGEVKPKKLRKGKSKIVRINKGLNSQLSQAIY